MRETSPDVPARLRAALEAAEFTVDAVRELLGEVADGALLRNETTPALRRTATDRGALATLTRLFLLQTTVAADAAEAALPGLVDRLVAEGVLDRSVSEVAARLDVRPYASDDHPLWVVSDLTPGLDGLPQRVGADHVLGISPASTSLAQLTIRDRVGRSLDLGTGCGVQALHLALHSDAVVATDVNPRALGIARFNAALNGVADRVEVRDGSFFEPVRAERYDLIATNPPFVISPATGERLVYRDSGLPGDQVVEDIVRAAPDHLTERGWCQVLANWVVERDRPWDERLAGWLSPDVDALVVQRELVDPAAYVELWLKDSGHHPATGGDPAEYHRRYDTWLSWLEEHGVDAVGFGWVNLRAGGTGRHDLWDWPYDVEQPIAPAIGAWADGVTSEIDRLSTFVRREDVVQETVGPAGAEDPETIVLRQQRGFRRARRADTVVAAVVGACDGELPLGPLLDAVAQLLDRDLAETTQTYLPVVRELVDEGFLVSPA
ncbi:MAG TPA: class I SAM-dependent methyltransferase [Nocardioides sp.]|uniref:N5-glutamine methyltransferase family protein n=1 Tax=uncultured Nocardioides sp. TaxID=198441 RepID=UPI000EED24F9|nr:class I SAM-dependent methyltransferase [uncultured Nocardioides sp.]HCB03701.1 transferase [Nocardioides sp.]HRD60393.1 class I SAM-dependent methyltransferase [Nocardioides sp.]HRI94843.1 class I SAM-dependent methyltransferase [Nocardioides sp.]